MPSWQPSLFSFNTPIDSGSIIKPCTLKLFQVPILAPGLRSEQRNWILSFWKVCMCYHKAVALTHICVSKQTIIGSDNGLSPYRRQTINWNQLQWYLNRNSYVFIIESAVENVVGNMAAILSRLQCVKLERALRPWCQWKCNPRGLWEPYTNMDYLKSQHRYVNIKCGMELPIYSQNPTAAPLKFGNGYVI